MRMLPHQIATAGASDKQALVYDIALDEYRPQTLPSLTVQDENGNVGTGVTQIDFQGPGVTAAAGTGEVVVTVPVSGITVQDENGTVATAVTQIDFQGGEVTATVGTGEVIVTIPTVVIPTIPPVLEPLTTETGGVPDFVWDDDNQLVMTTVV